MAQQAVLNSVKSWAFRPVKLGGRRYGGCGTLRIHVALKNGQMTAAIE
jgi:hypothetical protein